MIQVGLTPAGQILSLRVALAAARRDWKARDLALAEMVSQQHHPLDIIAEFTCLVVNLAHELDALGYVHDPDFQPVDHRGHEGAAKVIEDWTQGLLDAHDKGKIWPPDYQKPPTHGFG